MFGHDMPRAAEVRPAESLGELARVANRSVQAGTENLRVAGEALLQAKKLCRHGEWIPWLTRNITFSRSYASRLMRAAKRGTADGVLDAISNPAPDDDGPAKCEPSSHLESTTSAPTQFPAQTSDDIPPPPAVREPSPPVSPKPPWSAPAASRNGPSKPTVRERQEQAAFEEKHVKPLVDTSWIAPDVGQRLRGEELVAFVRGAVRKAEGLMSDVQSLRVHLDECPAVVQASFVCLELHTKLESALSQALLEVIDG